MTAPKIPPRAFTLKADARLNAIQLELRITRPEQEEPSVTAKSLWSTAVPHTLLSEVVVQALGLTESQGLQGESYYSVDIYLPNRIRCRCVPARISQEALAGGYDCIIGLDIISLGDLSLSYAGGKTMFSFRIPAQGGQDFVAEQNEPPATIAHNTAPQTPALKKPAKRHVIPATRDQLCPCGSGKKHKNCCGKINPGSGRGRKNKGG